MNENIERTKKVLNELMSEIVKQPFEINMKTGLLGAKQAFSTSIGRQMTLDAYIEDSEKTPSFLAFDVIVNPRFFIDWSVERMAHEIKQSLIRKSAKIYKI